MEWIKNKTNKQKPKPNYLLSARNSIHWQRHTQIESKRMESDIPGRQNLKQRKSRSIYTHI
jgi:hypothetical protein